MHQRGSGNLRHSGGFNDRRSPLTVSELRRLLLIRIHSAEGFAISVVHGDQVMMMTAATVFSELGLLIPHRLTG